MARLDGVTINIYQKGYIRKRKNGEKNHPKPKTSLTLKMGSLGQKIIFFKNMPKMNLQELFSESAQKTPGKKQSLFEE